MKRVRRWGWVVVIGSLPSLAVASSSCVTTLSYTPVERESGPDVPDLTPPNEPVGECALFLSTKTIDFTPIPLGKAVVKTFAVKNLTTTTIELSISSNNTRFTPKPASFPLGPSKTQAVEVTAVGDNLTAGPPSTLKLQVTSDAGASCSTTVEVGGGVFDRVRVVGPQPLELGSVLCKQAPAAKDLVIDSVKADPAKFTASVAAPFDVLPKSGDVTESGQTILKVSSLPLDGPAGTIVRPLALVVTSNIDSKSVATNIDVKAVAVGANLLFDPATLVFTGPGDRQTFTLQNTGNDAITVSLTAGSYGFSPSTFKLEAFPSTDAKKTVIVTAPPTQNGGSNVTVTATTSDGTLCAANTLTLKR